MNCIAVFLAVKIEETDFYIYDDLAIIYDIIAINNNRYLIEFYRSICCFRSLNINEKFVSIKEYLKIKIPHIPDDSLNTLINALLSLFDKIKPYSIFESQ